ncbi:MAG: methyltransferase [Scytonema sp. PMC 1069.18]|nr:methyltransferase [Scytonema sp. PMC 1069.18]MEC4882112.1 methyltransferase [Scytonema sp. PMC 1070.18]
MRIGLVPENLVEWVALRLGYVPTPSIETHAPFVLARSIIVATQMGVFEAIKSERLNSEEIALLCGAHPGALRKLLGVLESAGYLKIDRQNRYSLTPVVRKWLLKDSERSLYDYVHSRILAWEWLTRLEKFIHTGESVQMHKEMSTHQFQIYQWGMRSYANITADAVARRTPVPKGASKMLDIGGSHGYYSVSICRRHLGLQSIILDLPEAVQYSEPILATEGMGDRVKYWAGNVLTEDLGSNIYDLVFISNLIHHFDEAINCDLLYRAAQSLRPGGYLVIQETIPPNNLGQIAKLSDLFFALTSDGGNYLPKQIADWQRQAGLQPLKTIRFIVHPIVQQVAVKL